MRKAFLPSKNSSGRGQVEAELLRAGAADHDPLLGDSPGRVEAKTDRDSPLESSPDLLEPLELPFTFRVDDRHPVAHERFEVGVGLCRASREDLQRWTSCPEHREQLASG